MPLIKSPLKLTGTALIVILNLIFRQLPMSIRTIQSSMTQIEKATLNSAKDLGAHNLYILKDMVFPMTYSGLIFILYKCLYIFNDNHRVHNISSISK